MVQYIRRDLTRSENSVGRDNSELVGVYHRNTMRAVMDEERSVRFSGSAGGEASTGIDQ